MKMKISQQKIIIVTVAFIIPTILTAFMYKKTAGGHPSSTGAPGEQTCAQTGCHANAQVNQGAGVNTLIYPVADSTYVPGQTYTVTVQVQRPGVSKFGFELVVLKDNDSTSIGQLTATQTARTHTMNATVGGKSRDYITHSTNGTPATTIGNNSWTFDWKAPSQNEGNITFYYATNCTNNNGANTGDTLFLSSFTIKPKVFSSVNDIIAGGEFGALFNKYANSIEINYDLKIPAPIVLTLYDMQGKVLQSAEFTNKIAGKNTDRLELNQQLSSGIYNLSFIAGGKSVSKKIYIE